MIDKVKVAETSPINFTNPRREMIAMFFQNYAAVAGLILLVAIVLFVFVGPLFHTVDPFEMVWAPLPVPFRKDLYWELIIWGAIFYQL
jgi:peptide/nickel transport system permease protein